MRLVEIELSGWMPYAKRTVLQLPVGPVAIVGMHGGDERRSNRAGKTAFLEAITWCLYGTHRKRTDDAIINSECDSCEVIVTTETLRVKRSKARGSSTKLAVTYDAIEYAGETAQAVIARALGLSDEDYLATSCFRQGDVDSIVRKTSGERLALVSEWLQQHKWMRAKEIQAGRHRAAVKLLEDKRMARKMEGAHVLTDGILIALRNEFKRLDESAIAYHARMDALQAQLTEYSAIQQQIEAHNEVERLRGEAAELKVHLLERGKIKAELEAGRTKERQAKIDADKASMALAELKQLRLGRFNGVCPVTCDACPVSEDVTATVLKSSALLETRTLDDREARVVLGAARDLVVKSIAKSGELDRHAAHYQWCIDRGKEVAATITMTREELAAVPDADAASAELREVQQKHGKALTRIGEISALLDNSEQSQARCNELDAEAKKAETGSKVSHLALKAIASVPAKIAAQQLLQLEREVNVLLAASGISLRFSWTRELADKAPVCTECGHVFGTKRGDECPDCNSPRGKKLAQELELLCDDGSGVEEDVRYNSGGTRAIAGAAIRLGASAMLRQLRSSQITWAVVDEPFGSLDLENREQLARTFAGMLGSVGLEQALVVSHDPALLGALPNRIIIDKVGTSSTLRLE